MNFHSALYRGELVHARHDRFARVFRYPVYMAAIDPSELPALDRELHLFSHRRFNLYSLDDRDYTTPLAGSTRVITNLRALGYVFNPVSFFLRYQDSDVVAMTAEVNNNYGGRHCYELATAERLPGPRTGFRAERNFFVSPFLHGALVYDFWVDAPLDGPRLALEMHVHAQHDGHRVFTARFSGTRTAITDRALATAAVRYPLMAAQVIGLIHWQALKLHMLGAPYERPGPDHKPIS
jgi:DUF1365 family protein